MSHPSISNRRRIYWELYNICQGMKYVPVSERRGMCYMLVCIDQACMYYYIEQLNELIQFEPKNHRGYWFPLNNKGFNQRQEILLKAIKSTYK